MKEIESLLDIKEILEKIPDEELTKYGIGTNDEGDGEITIITVEGFDDKFEEVFEKLKPINEYLKRLFKAYEKNIKDEEFTTEGFI